MPIVADAAVAVRGDLSRFDNDLKRGFGDAERKAQTLGQKIKGALSPANLVGAAGGLFAGAQVVNFLNDSAAAASDLEEAQSKVNVVFGDGVDDINKWAEGSASGFLMSKRAALEAAGTYGNLFQAFGIARPAATEMSKTLVELAADLASFNNTSVEDALLALRSGLSGETEPLKRYGVAINQARLEQAAMTSGIWDGTEAMTAGQKAQAAYALILEDTALAQGDVARTSEGLANSQREMAAKIENAQAEIGKAWASIQLGAIRVIETLTDDPFEGFAMNFGEQAERVHDIADEMGEDFDVLKQKIEDRMDATGETFEEAATGIRNEWVDTAAALDHETDRAMYAMQRSVQDGGEEVVREFQRIADEGVSAMSERARDFRDAGYNSQVAYARGLLEGRESPLREMRTLRDLQKREWDQTAEVARLMGWLNSTRLAEGMASGDPVVRAQAEATRLAIVNQLASLGVEAYQWGYNSALGLAAGMDRGYGIVLNSAGKLGGAIRGQIGINSEPEDPNSPLRGITRWGGNIVKTIADGIYGELGMGRGAASALAGFLVPSFATPTVPAGSMVADAGRSVQYILNVGGVPKVFTSRDDFINALDDLSAFGGLDGKVAQ
jgi:hypothetical protein